MMVASVWPENQNKQKKCTLTTTTMAHNEMQKQRLGGKSIVTHSLTVHFAHEA